MQSSSTEYWLPDSAGLELAAVLHRNAAKTRMLALTNAYDPSEDRLSRNGKGG